MLTLRGRRPGFPRTGRCTNAGFISQTTQLHTQVECAQKCAATGSCTHSSYCPSSSAMCKSSHANACTLFTACVSTAYSQQQAQAGGVHSGYVSYEKGELVITYSLTPKNRYCADENKTDVKSQTECQSAATALELSWSNQWNGPSEHQHCAYAADGRSRVYYNYNPKPAAQPSQLYQSICKHLAPAKINYARVTLYNGATTNTEWLRTGASKTDYVWTNGWQLNVTLPAGSAGQKLPLRLSHSSSTTASSDVAIDNLIVNHDCGTNLACRCAGSSTSAEKGDPTANNIAFFDNIVGSYPGFVCPTSNLAQHRS